jgi:poly-beta-1,6-N-acetyl-D-glucosamine synthase
MRWLTLAVLLGVSMAFWTSVGVLRRLGELRQRVFWRRRRPGGRRLLARDVAVVIPARNEALVIAATIRSVLRLVPAGNVHVIADGCSDDTAGIARRLGANVLQVSPARGKAAGIEAVVRQFHLAIHYDLMLRGDADTELDPDYLRRGLPLFDDPGVVAVAGYARTSWHPRSLPRLGRVLVAYRTRLYAVMQWLKYGQTWRWTNLTAIVPGFASMYRTHVLPAIDLNPPGLVIEDFNMTFELHHKRLGRIAFHPGVSATTQDPDNLRDYYKQITRWQLGLWQTVRRHGMWPSWFCVALAGFLLEVVLASVVMLALLAVLVLTPLARLADAAAGWAWLDTAYGFLDARLSLVGVLLFVVVPDYLLTCAAAVLMRRPSLLRYGPAFLLIRFIDAFVMLATLPKAWTTTSNGRWESPGRRPQPGAAAASADPVVPAPRAPVEPLPAKPAPR